MANPLINSGDAVLVVYIITLVFVQIQEYVLLKFYCFTPFI